MKCEFCRKPANTGRLEDQTIEGNCLQCHAMMLGDNKAWDVIKADSEAFARVLIDEMGDSNDSNFTAKPKQMQRLVTCCAHPATRELTQAEAGIFVDGDEDDMLEIAMRHPILIDMHKVLNDIFNEEEE